MSPAMIAEPVEFPFGFWTWVSPRNHVLDGVQIPRGKRQCWQEKGRLCSELCKNGWTDQDTVWVVDLCGLKEASVTCGAHWRHLANTIEPSV